MGYWTPSALAQQIPQLNYGQEIVTATSVPVNASQFQVMIDISSAEADAAAAAGGWAAPVSSAATAWLQMQNVVKHGALALLYERIPNEKKASEYRASYQGMLTSLKEGTMVLLGGTRDTGETGRVLPRGASSPNLGPWSTGLGIGSTFF